MELRRIFGLAAALILMFGVVLCRVFYLATDQTYAANATGQTVQETELPVQRGNFYDRNGLPLTGTQKRWYALCVPGDQSYAALFPYVSYRAQTELYERRNSARPFLIEVDRDLSAQGVYSVPRAQRSLPLPIAVHVLGYLNGEGHGVTGLEAAYEEELAQAGAQQTIQCMTTAQGRLLNGSAPQLTTQQPGSGQGVQLALDADIQRLCEAVAQNGMQTGCIVVMDTGTGEVLASVSMPEYDPNHVAKSIAADDTSLLDRPRMAFSAGSVFKVVVAAAAYRYGLSWFTHECTGSVEVAGQVFGCAKNRAHGLVNLREALAESCNCYFVELGRTLGAQALLQEAQNFGFGAACALAPGMQGDAGVLPTVQALQNPGQLAMLSFGQGAFTATPLQVTAMMNTVARGGEWVCPRLVNGVCDREGKLLQATPETARRTACSADTARVLRSMLRTVVEEGIGTQAQGSEWETAGKTGTAQTGQFDEQGRELLNYWFSGFCPAGQPQYTITVLQDAALEPEYSSAELFARVADGLHAMQAAT